METKSMKATVSADLNLWDLISPGWWYRVAGDKEVHLKFADGGFEVSTSQDGVDLDSHHLKDWTEAVIYGDELVSRLDAESDPEAAVQAQPLAVVRVAIRDLVGEALDWVVMKIEHPQNSIDFFLAMRNKDIAYDEAGKQKRTGSFRYSERWDQGGVLSHRERINIQYCRDLRDRNGLYIHAEMDTHSYHGYWRGDHEQPLTAAMRCFVASKHREYVDVPAQMMN